MDERDLKIKARLTELAESNRELTWCVVGAGNGGLAMAGHLGILGFRVRVYNRSSEHLDGLRWHGGVKVEGAVRGFGPVEFATSEIEKALDGAHIIMVVTPSIAHAGLAKIMAPHLADGQVVVLNPGRTGGALEFRKVLMDEGAPGRPVIAEAQTFLYASRATSRHEAKIFKIKNGVPVASLPSYWTPEVLALLEGAFPQFSAGGNVLATSLENIGAVFHPALTILNAGWIEETRGDFDYYIQGITPSIAVFLEQVDQDRLAVARRLGVRSVSAREWLYLSYDSSGEDLYEAIHNTTAYRGIKAPSTINHRYVFEDIPMSLVPLSSMGAMLGVSTPAIDMVIELGSRMLKTDYWSVGRTVERLGIAGMSVEEIHRVALDPEGRE